VEAGLFLQDYTLVEKHLWRKQTKGRPAGGGGRAKTEGPMKDWKKETPSQSTTPLIREEERRDRLRNGGIVMRRWSVEGKDSGMEGNEEKV